MPVFFVSVSQIYSVCCSLESRGIPPHADRLHSRAGREQKVCGPADANVLSFKMTFVKLMTYTGLKV